jgi:hypothetical protein
MANIALLGNGFDLHHGLPTNYLDMMRFWTNVTRERFIVLSDDTLYSILDRMLKHCGADEDNVSLKTFQKKYSKSLQSISIDVSEFYELKHQLYHSFWFNYFQKNVKKNIGWIDFEAEIQKVLEIFRVIINNNYTESKINQYSGPRIVYSYVRNTSNHTPFPNFDIKINDGQIEVLFNEKYRAPSDIINEYNINVDLLVEDLYEDLEIIKKAICFYISYFIEGVSDCVEPSNSLYEVMGYDCVITLNYSNTYENVYQNAGLFGNPGLTKVFHYHGCIDDGDIVLGVKASYEDDELQHGQYDTTFLFFKKYFQRFMSDKLSDYDRNIDEYLKEVNLYLQEESSSDMVNSLDVIGHSLDVSDADLIRRLFAMCDVITIYYHNEKAKMNYKHNLIKIFGKTFVDRMALEKRILLKKLDDYSPMK